MDTIGSRFRGIPAGLPAVHVPHFRPSLVLQLLSPTLTVAMLGAIDSLMSAMVADRMAGTRHNSNVEPFAQGIVKIASPLFGALPATGAIARTVTNIRSGGKTPVAGMIHAGTLLLILVVAAPLASRCRPYGGPHGGSPVCYKMGEWNEVSPTWMRRWLAPPNCATRLPDQQDGELFALRLCWNRPPASRLR